MRLYRFCIYFLFIKLFENFLKQKGIDGYSYDDVIKYYLQEKYNSSNIETLKKTLNIKELINAATTSFLKTSNKSELRKLFNESEASIESLLISCEFNKLDCNFNEFIMYQMNEFVKCFKFNSGQYFNKSAAELKVQKRFEKNYGLKLKMFNSVSNICNSPFSLYQGKQNINICYTWEGTMIFAKIVFLLGQLFNQYFS